MAQTTRRGMTDFGSGYRGPNPWLNAEYNQAKEVERRSLMRASKLGLSEAELYKYFTREEAASEYLMATASAGSALHLLEAAEQIKSGKAVAAEEFLYDPAARITGHVDITYPSGAPADIKTVSPRRFQHVIQRGPFSRHIHQLNWYMYMKNAEKGYLEYVNRQNRAQRTLVEVPFSARMLEQDVAKIQRVRRRIQREIWAGKLYPGALPKTASLQTLYEAAREEEGQALENTKRIPYLEQVFREEMAYLSEVSRKGNKFSGMPNTGQGMAPFVRESFTEFKGNFASRKNLWNFIAEKFLKFKPGRGGMAEGTTWQKIKWTWSHLSGRAAKIEAQERQHLLKTIGGIERDAQGFVIGQRIKNYDAAAYLNPEVVQMGLAKTEPGVGLLTTHVEPQMTREQATRKMALMVVQAWTTEAQMQTRLAASMKVMNTFKGNKFSAMPNAGQGVAPEVRESLTEFSKTFASRWDPLKNIARKFFGKAKSPLAELRKKKLFQQALEHGEKVRKLGRGGFGEAFLYKTKFAGEEFHYVVKESPEVVSKFGNIVERNRRALETEYKALSELQGDIMPSAYGYNPEKGRLYMEYIQGKTAREMMEAGEEIPELVFQQIERQAAKIAKQKHLNYDINPGNIMYDPKTNRAAWIDFGASVSNVPEEQAAAKMRQIIKDKAQEWTSPEFIREVAANAKRRETFREVSTNAVGVGLRQAHNAGRKHSQYTSTGY